MVGEPSETRSEHLKTYVEPSVKRLVKHHQMGQRMESESAAIRDLILIGFRAKYGG